MRRFDGWEPTQTHHHEYEGDRLVRTTVVHESEWTADERAWMLALAEIEAAQCRRCGGDLHETTNPEHDGDNRLGKAHYVAQDPVVCHHCLALARSAKAHADSPKAAALIHVAKLITRKPRTRRR